MSDSVPPHRRQPTRLPVPGILQARTLEWVAISFSNAWKWKVKMKSLSRVRLLATPWTAAYQAPPSMGFSRQEYWSGLSKANMRVGEGQNWDLKPVLVEPLGSDFSQGVTAQVCYLSPSLHPHPSSRPWVLCPSLFRCIFSLSFYNFIYLWMCWVFTAPWAFL